MHALVEKAANYARAMHTGQRYGLRTYACHLKQVADMVSPLGPKAQAIAWLHDVVEDTDAEILDLKMEFGTDIAFAVYMLTDEGDTRKQRKLNSNFKLRYLMPGADALMVCNVRESSRLEPKLLKMCDLEHEAFKAAAYREGYADAWWTEMERLYRDQDS